MNLPEPDLLARLGVESQAVYVRRWRPTLRQRAFGVLECHRYEYADGTVVTGWSSHARPLWLYRLLAGVERALWKGR